MTIPKPLSPPAQALLQRLDAGYARIADAPDTDPPAWETFWLDLLHDYETVCNEMNAVQAGLWPTDEEAA